MNSKLINLSSYVHKNLVDNNYKYNKRKRKTDILDGFMFNLLYTQKGKSQDAICGDLNCLNQQYNNNNIHVSRQAF